MRTTDFPKLDAYSRGEVQLKAGDYASAYRSFIEAVRLDATHVDAWLQLGFALRKMKKLELSHVCLRKAFALRPDAISHFQLGETLRLSRRYSEAEKLLQEAIRLNPELAIAWYALALLYMMAGRIDEAIFANEKAAVLEPESNEVKWIQPALYLMKGDYQRGFENFGSKREFERANLKLPQPVWSGEDLSDKTLHIINDQGFGDVLQFVRYLKLIPAKQVVVSIPSVLQKLLSESFVGTNIKFLSERDSPAEADYCLSLYKVPKYFSKGQIPNAPYLSVPESTLKISKPIGAKLAVGFCWAGNPTHEYDWMRSASADAFVTALARPGVELYSLQVSAASDPALVGEIGIAQDLAPMIKNFADTAALVRQLDFVVSVDTSIVHLCGALEIPCHVVVAYGSVDWRWRHNTSKCDWYKSVTIHRQQEGESWLQTLGRLADAIF